jgi:hypothetical protein
VTVLVDTSVWVRFLANRAPYAAELDEDYEQMHQAPLVPHADVVAFVRGRQLHGRGIGWIEGARSFLRVGNKTAFSSVSAAQPSR